MNNNKIKCLIELEKATDLASVIAIIGPTGSGKSTLLSFLVNPDNNRLLSNNIGDNNQTTKIKFKLSLTTLINHKKIFIKAKRLIVGKTYFRNMANVLAYKIYEIIDDGDDISSLEINDKVIEEIFNPINKEYKAYEYLINEYSNKINELISIIENLLTIDLSQLEESCKSRFKTLKNTGKKLKKQECYIEVIIEKLFENLELYSELKLRLTQWISNFENSIVEYYDRFFDDKNEKTIYTDIDNENLKLFIKEIFAENSVFSLVFSELIYVTRPSEGLIKYYEDNYKYSDEPLILNLLDTMGISHLSDEKSNLEDSIDDILGSVILDGILFICKSDEKLTVYENSLKILEKKSIADKGKLANKPVTIVRTKADTIVKNKAINEYRKDTGKNEIPEEEYTKYYTEALENYKKEYIILPTEQIGDDNLEIDYLSLAPNETRDLKIVLNNNFSEEKLYKIILDLNDRIQKKYSQNGKVVATVKDGENIEFSHLINIKDTNLEKLLVEKNQTHKNGQYLKYLNGYYNGRSICNWYYKHKNGLGHSSASETCDNFRIYIAAMIGNWIRGTNLFQTAFLHNLNLENLNVNESELNEKIKDYFKNNRWQLIDELAFKLSYEFIEEEFIECYRWSDWRCGFGKSLLLFDKKFSDEQYWKEHIKLWVNEKVAKVLTNILYIKK